MNVKTLTTSVATAALVGALGLAYAQSSNDATTPAPADSTTQQAAPTAPAPMPADSTTRPAVTPSDSSATPSSSASPAPSDTMTEPAPQADRG